MCPGLSLPPEPIITRWGTWLTAAVYYCDNFCQVKSVVDFFDDDDAEAIRLAKLAFADGNVKADLTYIKNNFESLISSTIKLESQGLALAESVEIISSVQNTLSSLAQTEFNQKMDAVLRRNPGFRNVVDINNVLNKRMQPTENYVQSLTPRELASFKYAPTTSADVERSFSRYKNVFSDDRRRFLFENLKQHLIVHCNREE